MILVSWLWMFVIDVPLEKESIRRVHAGVNSLLNSQLESALDTGQCNKLANKLVTGLPGVRITITKNGHFVCSTHSSDQGWQVDDNYPPITISKIGMAFLYHVEKPKIIQQVLDNLSVGVSIGSPDTFSSWRGRFVTVMSTFVAVLFTILFLVNRLKNTKLRELNKSLSVKESNLFLLYDQKEMESEKNNDLRSKVTELESDLIEKLEIERSLKDKLAEIVIGGREGESLNDLIHGVSVSLKKSKLEIDRVSLELNDAYEGWEAESDADHEKIEELQTEINQLNEEVKNLREEELGVISKQQLKDQVQLGTQKLDRVKKLWESKKLTWKERKEIESEISQDTLPFSAFIAMISIERHLRTMSGVGDDSRVKKSVFINDVIKEQNQRERVWKVFNARDKWFHGERSPNSYRQYETIINLANEIEAKAISI